MIEKMIETFENDRDILRFWSQLEFQDFEEWLSMEQKNSSVTEESLLITKTTTPKTTITTVKNLIESSTNFINGSSTYALHIMQVYLAQL